MNPDFIIVGAGVYGTATAWWLAQRGASSIVLDSRDIATRASGGPGRRGVRANARDKAELPLMRHAYELWPQLHEVLEAKPFYERTGHLLLGETDEDVGAGSGGTTGRLDQCARRPRRHSPRKGAEGRDGMG